MAIAAAVLRIILQHDPDRHRCFLSIRPLFRGRRGISSDSPVGRRTRGTTVGIADSGWRRAAMAGGKRRNGAVFVVSPPRNE